MAMSGMEGVLERTIDASPIVYDGTIGDCGYARGCELERLHRLVAYHGCGATLLYIFRVVWVGCVMDLLLRDMLSRAWSD